MKAFTFRGSRQRPSASCDHVHDGQPVRGDRSLLPFSRGNHACSHDDGCVAGMFFSFSYRCFNYYYFPAGLRRSSGKEPSLRLGCKVTHIFRIGKELYGFSCPVSCFFLSRRKAGLADTQAVHGKSIPTSHRFGNTLTARNRRYGGRGKRVRRPSYGHHHGRHTRVRRPPYPHPEPRKA